MGRQCAGPVLLFLLAVGGAVSQSLRSPRTPFHQLLHKTISGATPPTENVVFSPYSVATALTLLREAAGGSSRQEIASVLGRGHRQARQANVERRGATLRLWDALYFDKSIAVERDYQHTAQELGAAVLPQPFSDRPEEAAAAINSDVARETLGEVRRLVPDPDPDTLAMLVSAVYFRAEWRTAFDAERTRPSAFTAADGRRQKVNMMEAEELFGFLRSEEDGFSSVAIPYQEERFQMILVLPDKGVDISEVVSRFDVDLMYKAMRVQRTIVKFPKFRVQSQLPLEDILRKLGIHSVFTRHADLSALSPDPRLYVSSVRHTATIETDEAGTEAAAATAAGISARSFFTPPTPALIANRPFLFFVYDVDTANVLFSGQIRDAAAAQSAEGSITLPEVVPVPSVEPLLELVEPLPEVQPLLEVESLLEPVVEPEQELGLGQELTAESVVLGQDPALDSQLQLEPDLAVETLLEQPGLLDSLQEVLGQQRVRGGRRGGRRGRGRVPTGPTATGPTGFTGTGPTGVTGTGPTGLTGPTGTGPAFTGPARGGVRGPGRRRPVGQRPVGQRRGGRRLPPRRFNRRRPAFRPPPPPPPPLPPPPPRRRRPVPRRRPPPPPPPPRRRSRPIPRARPVPRARPIARPRRLPPVALPGSTFNVACNCYDPPVYPTAPVRRDQRVVNINVSKPPTPLVTNLWATPTASIWTGAATTDPLLWSAGSSLWPSTGIWSNPLATTSLLG